MRWVLLAAIQAYWRLKPPNGWRTCLFRESCSRHVYRRTVEDGLFAGLLALRLRMRRCRPGFVVLPATPSGLSPWSSFGTAPRRPCRRWPPT
jgi:hypothetical protein